MSRRPSLRRSLHLAAVTVVAAGVLLALSTALGNLWTADLGRDGSAFALRAHLWLRHGLLPYRDLWDHKPPGIYVADMLGEAVTGDPVLGARAMESATILLCVALAVALGRRTASWAWGACLAFWYLITTAQPALVQWGNFTELVLPPTAFLAALALTGRPSPRWTLVGVLCGAAVLFRPTAAGLWVGAAAAAMILGEERAGRRRALLRLTAGAAGPPALVACVLWLHRLFPSFWDQVVTYNRMYAREAGGDLAAHVIRAWAHALWTIPGSRLLAALTVVLALATAAGDRSPRDRGRRALALFAAGSLAVIWSGESLSGRFWPHQLLMAAPFLVLLAASASPPSPGRVRDLGLGLTAAAVLFLSPGLLGWWSTGNTAHRADAAHLAMRRFLQTAAEPGDRLQVWGAEDGLHLATGLLPASRYTYYYPLLTPGYGDRRRTNRFLQELETNRPRWVVTYVADTTLSPARAGAPAHAVFLAWLRRHGRPVARFGNLVCWELTWGGARRVAPLAGAGRSPASAGPRPPDPARRGRPR